MKVNSDNNMECCDSSEDDDDIVDAKDVNENDGDKYRKTKETQRKTQIASG